MENNLFILKLKNGDQQAIERLVLDNKDVVFRTCLAYVQNVNDAEDLTQEVFVKILEKLPQFKGKSNCLHGSQE
jgi:RNA polymerase sigma-70 factor (ECF subfamily)